ncbi:MAG: N-acetylglucosamine-6-phosphate deacetylase [Clostridia bacterium]|nr:N-acetylglucosamine-6-phosphate deacetylase [Clostridia bacterium]
MSAYRLKNGILITEHGLSEQDLLIKNGAIEALVGRDAEVSDSYTEIDCTDCWVSPGFVDIHQHGGGGSDYMDDAEDAYLNATNAHLRCGTTSIMPTLTSASGKILLNSIERYKKAEKDKRITANILGLHVEGPYVSPVQAGAQPPEHIRQFDESEYTAAFEASEGSIRRWSVAPELEGADRFAEFANSNGITLSIAHSNADLDTVKRAFDMGYRHITHFYSCCSTITRRGGFRVPGVLEAGYLIDGMDVEIIADGCHLPQSLLQYVQKFKAPERIALITDSMRAAGQQTDRSFLGSMSDPLPVIVEDGVAKLLDRSAFAGSVATGDRLLRTMLQSGTSLIDGVKMLTVNPLRQMNLNVKKGVLKQGYDADVCVLDRSLNVKTVICRGKIV